VAVEPEVREAVVSAYYARTMASSDAARQRAQAAYGIASALAVGVGAAGLFGNLDNRPVGVQIAAVLALMTWLVAAGLFLHTVSSPFEIPVAPQFDPDAFVEGALRTIREERRTIDCWQRRAHVASGVAALVTVLAFAAAIRFSSTDEQQTASVALNKDGMAAMSAACRHRIDVLRGKIPTGGLAAEFVELRVARGVCGRRPTQLAIPRDEVAAVAHR
jgi:hypothetical protein